MEFVFRPTVVFSRSPKRVERVGYLLCWAAHYGGLSLS